MDRNLSQWTLLWVIAGVFGFTLSARAVPVKGLYIDDPAHCDNHGDLLLTHELGEATVFPTGESIVTSASLAQLPNMFSCVGDDGIFNDYLVIMTNTSGRAWKDLFFVADLGYSVGNYDGVMTDTTYSPTSPTRAFRIDRLGSNIPLVAESGPANGIFDIGETWEFTVTNWSDSVRPFFDSVGLFSETSGALLPVPSSSTASILATPVPEPVSASLLAMAGVSFLVKRQRSS